MPRPKRPLRTWYPKTPQLRVQQQQKDWVDEGKHALKGQAQSDSTFLYQCQLNEICVCFERAALCLKEGWWGSPLSTPHANRMFLLSARSISKILLVGCRVSSMKGRCSEKQSIHLIISKEQWWLLVSKSRIGDMGSSSCAVEQEGPSSYAVE